jgi:hypothetical protein
MMSHNYSGSYRKKGLTLQVNVLTRFDLEEL